MNDLLGQLAEHGILGLLLAIVLVAYWMKDRALIREKDARIADSRVFTDLAMKLQESNSEYLRRIEELFRSGSSRRAYRDD